MMRAALQVNNVKHVTLISVPVHMHGAILMLLASRLPYKPEATLVQSKSWHWQLGKEYLNVRKILQLCLALSELTLTAFCANHALSHQLQL